MALHYNKKMEIKITNDTWVEGQPEPPELTLAKKEYDSDGLFLPSATPRRVTPKRNSIFFEYGRRIQKPYPRNEKFWPYKKWILYNGEWSPSLEMPEPTDRRTHAGRAYR